jgi:plastocyanin
MTLAHVARRASVAGVMFSALLLVCASVASADGAQRIQMRDDCDPKTFNAAIGPGACVGKGGTTFQEFIARLTRDRKVGAWKFEPDKVDVKPATTLWVVNDGGETHSFTCVTKFGGGIVPLLNELSGNTTPAVLCPGQDPHVIPAQHSLDTPINLAPGTYKFQCLIHPWMRTTVTVKES